MAQTQQRHPLDELTDGCAFCAKRVPQTVTWQCGCCGKTVTYILPVEEEEAETTLVIPLDLPEKSVVIHT